MVNSVCKGNAVDADRDHRLSTIKPTLAIIIGMFRFDIGIVIISHYYSDRSKIEIYQNYISLLFLLCI